MCLRSGLSDPEQPGRPPSSGVLASVSAARQRRPRQEGLCVMPSPSAQIRVRHYVSGCCEAAWHDRCKGSYAGTACCCPCHRRTDSGTEATGTTAAPRGSGE